MCVIAVCVCDGCVCVMVVCVMVVCVCVMVVCVCVMVVCVCVMVVFVHLVHPSSLISISLSSSSLHLSSPLFHPPPITASSVIAPPPPVILPKAQAVAELEAKTITLESITSTSLGTERLLERVMSFMDPVKLERLGYELHEQYINAKPFPHIVIDDFWPEDFVAAIEAEVPDDVSHKTGLERCHGSAGCFTADTNADKNQIGKSAMTDEAVMGPYLKFLFAVKKVCVMVVCDGCV